MGGSDNPGDGLASQPCLLPGARVTPAQPASGEGCLPQPRWAVFATGGGCPSGADQTRAPQPTPHTNTSNPPRSAQVPSTPPVVPPARPSVPLRRHCAQQEHWPPRRPIDSTGGSAGRPDSQWASRAPEELRKMVSARRGWGTQRANPGAPAAQRLCPSTLRGACTQWATTGAPDAFHAATSGALDSHPLVPSHVASGGCFLSAAAAGAPAGVVSVFAEPSGWCAGAVLDVACAVCASAAPSSWRIGGCAGCCGGRLTVLTVHTPPSSGRPQPASLCFRVREAQVPCSAGARGIFWAQTNDAAVPQGPQGWFPGCLIRLEFDFGIGVGNTVCNPVALGGWLR